MSNLVKIYSHKVRSYSHNGLEVTIPPVWVKKRKLISLSSIGFWEVPESSPVTTLEPGDLILRLEEPDTEDTVVKS